MYTTEPPAPLNNVSQGGHFLLWGYFILNVKEPKTLEEQVEIIRLRGCTVTNDEYCKKRLGDINYYRLSAYFLPFKTHDDKFFPGTSFETICGIYDFDQELRDILFGIIGRIEVMLRAKIAHFFAIKYGSLGYIEQGNFNERGIYSVASFRENFEREVRSNKDVLFVKHHLDKYDGQFPIWVAVELFSFGMLSRFYSGMKTQDQKEIAKTLFGSSYKNIKSWLKCCTDVRNICAHYGRLYYRKFASTPLKIDNIRLWGVLMVLRNLYVDKEQWNKVYACQIISAVKRYQDCIKLSHVGFPEDWEKQLYK